MNDKIISLPKEVVMKIAAGEVVEKPASIVKELVENSIDAGATAITVEIKDGGISYLRVVDNGSGIRENMIALAFERHSTSKLFSSNDLFNIKTLGFRGEALASIAAVSKVTLTTKHKEAENGVTVENHGGVITNIKPSAFSMGTSIVVKELFFNTPVRLKFLKKPISEASSISDLLMRLILSRPDISFRYVNNGKTIYHSIGDGKLESAISRVYDVSTAKKLIEVNYSSNGIIIKGYVGVFDLEKGNRSNQTFFVNGRYFKDDIVSSALETSCRGFVTVSKFPMCIIDIIVPYNSVDVNVHPNKLEVRFENPNLLKEVIIEAVTNALNNIYISNEIINNDNINEAKLNLNDEIFNTFDDIKNTTYNVDVLKPNLEAFKNVFNNDSEKLLSDSSYTVLEPKIKWRPLEFSNNSEDVQNKNNNSIQETFIENKPEIDIRDSIIIIGTIFNTFILLEYKEKLLIIDQHAAFERINFEKMLTAYKNKNLKQEYLTPILINLNQREIDFIREHQDELYDSGFDITFFDDDSIAVRSVPILLGEPMSIKSCLQEIFNNWDNKKDNLSKEIAREKILQFACKHSIKAGDKLDDDTIFQIVKQLFIDNIVPTCPHGRPIIIELTKNELYKRFKRIQ